MTSKFEKYKIALLDASFFRAKISDEILDLMKNKPVYVAETFVSEIDQYPLTMDPIQGTFFRTNLEAMRHLPKFRRLDFSGAGTLAEGMNADVWGFLNFLDRKKACALLLSGDETLIQRVVLENKQIDIYNLFSDELIPHESFAALAKELEYSEKREEQVPAIPKIKVGQGDSVYLENGRAINLGSELESSGMEGRLYRVSGSVPMVAKIFRTRKLSRAKWENLKKITSSDSFLRYSWAILPSKLLYYDREGCYPAGFLEAYVNTNCNLSEAELYLGNIDLPDEILDTRLSDTLEIAIKVTRQVCVLNCCGFLVSDFNIRNFSFPVNKKAAIQMWDTDSFAYGSYFSDFWDGNNMSIDYDTSQKKNAIRFCNEALYQFVFSLLSLGDHPISGSSGSFKYENSEYIAYFRKKLFPENLWKLFFDMFRGNCEPSPTLLLFELCQAKDVLQRYGANHTYKQLLAEELAIIRKMSREDTESDEDMEKAVEEDIIVLHSEQSTEVLHHHREPAEQEMNEGVSSFVLFLLFILTVILVVLAYFCFFGD